MFNPSPNAEHSPPQNPPSSSSLPDNPDFAMLAEKLHETALILAAAQSMFPGPAAEKRIPELRESLDISTRKKNSGADGEGETRSYYFSPAVLRHERELLRKYRANDFLDLLAETHKLLIGLVKTMKSVHSDARLRGNVVASLGCLLEHASSLILRMQNVYANVELVKK